MSRRISSDDCHTRGHRRHPAAPPAPRAPRRRTQPAGSADGDTSIGIAGNDLRLQKLFGIHPRHDEDVIADLREIVVATLAAVPYVNDHVDRTRASILYRYAVHMHTLYGTFEPGRHLVDEQLVDYWTNACADLTPRSKDKALSTLRTIASRRPFAEGLLMRRPPTSPPYSESQWRTFRAAVDRLISQDWAGEAHMLLDLTGEAGLRGAEINRIRGTALSWSGATILANVDATTTNRRRTVPIDGDAAVRLAPYVGSNDHLLRPHYRNRKNAVTSLVTRLANRDGTFADFRAAAARHRWIAQLLAWPIAHLDLVYLAGLERDSHTLHDISAHLAPATPTHATRALLRARSDASIGHARPEEPRPS